MIYVVRHGQTDLNKEGRLQGRKGLPLNEEGAKQAQSLGSRLENMKFDCVFSSPQERAVQTAAIATGMEVRVDPRLDVFDLGEADGLKKSEVTFAGAAPDSRFYQGVEDVHSFIRRVFAFMQELEASYGATGKEVNIMLSGHKCTTGAIGAYFKGIPEDGNIMRYSSGNGEFQTYDFPRG